jgi:hypothetical protein
MTEEEKTHHPAAKMQGGYLKTYTYKEAWRRSWDAAYIIDKKRVLDLPNFDNEIFKEITGIDVLQELQEEEN